ncbi:MAG: hypothetical protein KDD78_19410 [Caldilineaceae bacterium]|nr:hypothetical protein [Caldilineaceae bacterium]
MDKVFGIGWAKTGTTTLGACFKILGFNHQSRDLALVQQWAQGDLSRIMAVAQTKESFDDWPWLRLYAEMDRAFPGSRFVLTHRAPERWVGSYRNMLQDQRQTTPELTEIRRFLYGLPFPECTEEQLLARYQRHNDDVMTYFADRPSDLLVVNWEAGDGWPELCRFLGREIPATPFPHANQGNYNRNSLVGRVLHAVKSWRN